MGRIKTLAVENILSNLQPYAILVDTDISQASFFFEDCSGKKGDPLPVLLDGANRVRSREWIVGELNRLCLSPLMEARKAEYLDFLAGFQKGHLIDETEAPLREMTAAVPQHVADLLQAVERKRLGSQRGKYYDFTLPPGSIGTNRVDLVPERFARSSGYLVGQLRRLRLPTDLDKICQRCMAVLNEKDPVRDTDFLGIA